MVRGLAPEDGRFRPTRACACRIGVGCDGEEHDGGDAVGDEVVLVRVTYVQERGDVRRRPRLYEYARGGAVRGMVANSLFCREAMNRSAGGEIETAEWKLR